MDSGDLHYCEAFPSDIDDSMLTRDTSPSQNDGQFFNINIKLTEMKLILNPNSDVFYCTDDKTTEYHFPNIPLTAMKECTILQMLSDIGVPEDAQNFMTSKILACARDMAQRTHKTQKLLPMQVFIYTTTSFEEEVDMDDEDEIENEEQEQEGFEEDFMEDLHDTTLVPNIMSFDELERVNVRELGFDVGRCTICLEGYEVDSEAIRMPCLHLYHQNCIVEWLQKSSSPSCPLCRFPMPSASSKD